MNVNARYNKQALNYEYFILAIWVRDTPVKKILYINNDQIENTRKSKITTPNTEPYSKQQQQKNICRRTQKPGIHTYRNYEDKGVISIELNTNFIHCSCKATLIYIYRNALRTKYWERKKKKKKKERRKKNYLVQTLKRTNFEYIVAFIYFMWQCIFHWFCISCDIHTNKTHARVVYNGGGSFLIDQTTWTATIQITRTDRTKENTTTTRKITARSSET